jgi:hypothetical protein
MLSPAPKSHHRGALRAEAGAIGCKPWHDLVFARARETYKWRRLESGGAAEMGRTTAELFGLSDFPSFSSWSFLNPESDELCLPAWLGAFASYPVASSAKSWFFPE